MRFFIFFLLLYGICYVEVRFATGKERYKHFSELRKALAALVVAILVAIVFACIGLLLTFNWRL